MSQSSHYTIELATNTVNTINCSHTYCLKTPSTFSNSYRCRSIYMGERLHVHVWKQSKIPRNSAPLAASLAPFGGKGAWSALHLVLYLYSLGVVSLFSHLATFYIKVFFFWSHVLEQKYSKKALTIETLKTGTVKKKQPIKVPRCGSCMVITRVTAKFIKKQQKQNLKYRQITL